MKHKCLKLLIRAETIEPLMIGSKAPNLILRDSSDVIHNLYEIDKELTCLFFTIQIVGIVKKKCP